MLKGSTHIIDSKEASIVKQQKAYCMVQASLIKRKFFDALLIISSKLMNRSLWNFYHIFFTTIAIAHIKDFLKFLFKLFFCGKTVKTRFFFSLRKLSAILLFLQELEILWYAL